MPSVRALPLVSPGRDVPAAREAAPPVRAAAKARRVALVCTPFHSAGLPSLALGTLAEILRAEGHHVDVVHLNLDFASRIGITRYEELCSYPAWLRLLGEWLFADEHVAPGAAGVEAYRAHLEAHRFRDRALFLERHDLAALRAEADRAVERWFASRDWGSYDVVGFNAMFQQMNPSLRLGYRIKRAFRHVRVILGGSATEVPMGQPVLDRHAWLDAVFSGYAERSLPDYVAALPPRRGTVITQSTRVEMDELPIPSYDEFFEDARRLGLEDAANVHVPLETSRGCWWGEKNHCTFCGLNALDMTQRSKSPERAFEEISRLSRYGKPFFATDNILPREYFGTLLARLPGSGIPFDAFYETKANLTLAELRTLAQAGVTSIQPGIESLSTPILRSMKKGVSAAQNLWLLRAAEEIGMGVAWSILYGFPGEDPAEYRTMAELLPSLSHLPPPLRPAPVLLERYSPLFDGAAEQGLLEVRPTPSHRLAFGDAPRLEDRAYVFDFAYGDGRTPETYTARLNAGVLRWIEARRRPLSPRCEVFRFGPVNVVFDSRALGHVGRGLPRFHVLGGAEQTLVELTRELTDVRKLRSAWARDEPLDGVVTAFERRRWLVRKDGRLVRILMMRDEPYVGAELRRAARGGLGHARRLAARVRASVKSQVARAGDAVRRAIAAPRTGPA